MDTEAKQIAEHLSKHTKNKDAQIDAAMGRIKEYLMKRNISSFSRNYLNGMLEQYMNVSPRTKQMTVTQILSKLKSTERVRVRKYLSLDINHVDRVWRQKGVMEKFYYFEEMKGGER